jgi:altronate dehydratase small subunit
VSSPSATDATDATDRSVLLLSPEDNVVVACRDLVEGEQVAIEGITLILTCAVPTGHKLARRAIRAGERVLKYGAPIGSARVAVAAGDYVHTHNLKSDYIPSFGRDGRELA